MPPGNEQIVLVKAADIVTALQASNILLGQIIQTLNTVFPQNIGTSGSATGGAATLPANPVGFLNVINPATGDTVLIPYYSP